jgi:hypothetical protein
MRVWTIHDPNPAAAPSASRANDIVIVKDGFAWWALFFPLIWLLVQRLWRWALLYVVLSIALYFLLRLFPVGGTGTFLLYLLLHLWVAFDGNDMRRRRLLGRGYAEVARLPGRNRDAVERAFFERWLPTDDAAAPPPSVPPRHPPPPPNDPQVVGLFPEPGGTR